MGALGELVEALQADGADLRLLDMDDSRLTLELIVVDSTCMDCLVDHELMVAMAGDALERAGLGDLEVVLQDPRTAPGWNDGEQSNLVE